MKVRNRQNIPLNNLPTRLSSFIGREHELMEVKQLLSVHRLVTLPGAGRSGKTRLALQVAADVIDLFDNGAWWVELAALSDETLVPQAVAKALSVREVPNQPLSETLANDLGAKELLLVIDNCEHLIIAETWDADNEMPSTLMGQVFHYVGAPNRYRIPAFYELHVWAWKQNPLGMFTDWNPRVSCEDYIDSAAQDTAAHHSNP